MGDGQVIPDLKSELLILEEGMKMRKSSPGKDCTVLAKFNQNQLLSEFEDHLRSDVKY